MSFTILTHILQLLKKVWLFNVYINYIAYANACGGILVFRGVPIWEFWVLLIPIMFLSESTDTDHQSDIDLAYVKQ